MLHRNEYQFDCNRRLNDSVKYRILQQIMHYLQHYDRVLEIGCKNGNLARELINEKYHYEQGIDSDKKLIDEAQKGFFPSRFLHHDISKDYSPLKSGRYNTIIAIEVLEYFENDLLILNEIPTGITIYATLPSSKQPDTYIAFPNIIEIHQRYGKILNIKTIMLFQGKQVTYLVIAEKK